MAKKVKIQIWGGLIVAMIAFSVLGFWRGAKSGEAQTCVSFKLASCSCIVPFITCQCCNDFLGFYTPTNTCCGGGYEMINQVKSGINWYVLPVLGFVPLPVENRAALCVRQ